MAPKEPTPSSFDKVETTYRPIQPDGSMSNYNLTVQEYHQRLMHNRRESERLHNRRQIEIGRRVELMNRIQNEINTFPAHRPPRAQGESMIEYLQRLRGLFPQHQVENPV